MKSEKWKVENGCMSGCIDGKFRVPNGKWKISVLFFAFLTNIQITNIPIHKSQCFLHSALSFEF